MLRTKITAAIGTLAALLVCFTSARAAQQAQKDNGQQNQKDAGQKNQKDDGQQNQNDDGQANPDKTTGGSSDLKVTPYQVRTLPNTDLKFLVPGRKYGSKIAKAEKRVITSTKVRVKVAKDHGGQNQNDGQRNQKDDRQRNQKDDGQQDQRHDR